MLQLFAVAPFDANDTVPLCHAICSRQVNTWVVSVLQ